MFQLLLTVILVLGINKIADSIYYVQKPDKSAYQIDSAAIVEEVSSTEKSSEDSGARNIMAIFASVSADDGAKIFKKCAACHSIS